jgi:hypothetical protein
MSEVKHILIAVELHEQHAVPVLQWATLMARQTEGRLTLLHVNETTATLHSRGAFASTSGIDSKTGERWRHQYETTTRTELHKLIAWRRASRHPSPGRACVCGHPRSNRKHEL